MAQISVRPDQLNAIAQDLRTHTNRIEAAIQAIDAEMRRLGAENFAGQSADALRMRYSTMQQRLTLFGPMLNKFATQLDEAASAFRQADLAARGAGGTLPSGGNWHLADTPGGALTTSSGLGSPDHIRAIQEINKTIDWKMW